MRAPRNPTRPHRPRTPRISRASRDDLPLGQRDPPRWLSLKIILGVALWIGAYGQLGRFAGWLTYDVVRPRPSHPPGCCVDFFVTDVPKIFLLLAGIIPVVSIIRSYFPPER